MSPQIKLINNSELIEAFSNEFNVDMTGFRISEYFGPEFSIGLTTFYILIRRFMKPPVGNAAGISKLLVSDLIRAASQKKWI